LTIKTVAAIATKTTVTVKKINVRVFDCPAVSLIAALSLTVVVSEGDKVLSSLVAVVATPVVTGLFASVYRSSDLSNFFKL